MLAKKLLYKKRKLVTTVRDLAMCRLIDEQLTVPGVHVLHYLRFTTLAELVHLCCEVKLFSKITSSDLIDFFFVESNGEGLRSKFEQEHGQTDGEKSGTCERWCRQWCNLAIIQGHASNLKCS